MHKLLIVLAIAVAAAACRPTERVTNGEVIETTGTVQFVDLEGGFYGIIAEDGTRYDPIELEDALKEDGLRVRFRAERQEDVATIRMWGEVVRILQIERL